MNMNRSLRFATDLQELERIQAAIKEMGEEADWPPDFGYQVNLVLEELVVNVINYGHRGDPNHEIEITLDWEADKLTMEMVDDAPAFNPLEDNPEPDLTSKLEDRPVGGLGIFLVHHLMDEIQYRREGGRNHLTLVKRRDK